MTSVSDVTQVAFVSPFPISPEVLSPAQAKRPVVRRKQVCRLPALTETRFVAAAKFVASRTVCGTAVVEVAPEPAARRPKDPLPQQRP